MERTSHDPSSDLHILAPWLPRRRCRCNDGLRKVVGAIVGILLVVYLILVRILIICLKLLKLVLELFASLAARNFGLVVEYTYRLRIGWLHAFFAGASQRHLKKRPYHSRYVDVRTQIILKDGGICYIHAIPNLTDNYCYALVDASEKSGLGLATCLIDVGDADAVAEALEHIGEKFYADEVGLRLEAILSTHRHWDHTGGNEGLASRASEEVSASNDGYCKLDAVAIAPASSPRENDEETPSRDPTADSEAHERPLQNFLNLLHPLPIFGCNGEDVPGCTQTVRHGEIIHVGGLKIQVIAVPGHTIGSILYRLVDLDVDSVESERPSRDVVFTGDCLFCGGCGAHFEGSPLDTQHCFATILEYCSSPTETLLFPGHEYTYRLLNRNLDDALTTWALAEPPGHFLSLCGAVYTVGHRRALRDAIPTVPSTLANERMLNPNFDPVLLDHVNVLLQAAESRSPSDDARDEKSTRFTPGGVVARPPSSTNLELSRLNKELLDRDGLDLKSQNGSNEERLPLLRKVEDSGVLNSINEKELNATSQTTSLEGLRLDTSPDGDRLASPLPLTPEECIGTSTSRRFTEQNRGTAFQFAFLCQDDFREVVKALSEGRLQGKEAAEKLLQCEQQMFVAPVLTGDDDKFGDEGFQEDPADEKVDMGDEDSPSPPSEKDLIRALKVLGVLPQVPVGPKAPCDELLLPVSLSRIESLLQRLDVPARKQEQLMSIISKETNDPHESQNLTVSRALEAIGCRAGFCADGSFAEIGSGDIRILRDVLHALRPRSHEFGGLFSFLDYCCIRVPKGLNLLCRAAFSVFTCPSRREEDEETKPDDASEDEQAAKERRIKLRRQQFSKIEATFRSHDLDECSVCAPGFRERPLWARRKPDCCDGDHL